MLVNFFYPKTFRSWENFNTKKFKVKKFGQNLVLLLRYCCHVQMSSGQRLPGQISPRPMASVKIGSVTADILLMWTNDARSNVAWTSPCDFCHLLNMVPESWLWNLIKIGPVTAEILLIWTNVDRTNVALTNVHLTIVLDCPEYLCTTLLKWFYD